MKETGQWERWWTAEDSLLYLIPGQKTAINKFFKTELKK